MLKIVTSTSNVRFGFFLNIINFHSYILHERASRHHSYETVILEYYDYDYGYDYDYYDDCGYYDYDCDCYDHDTDSFVTFSKAPLLE